MIPPLEKSGRDRGAVPVTAQVLSPVEHPIGMLRPPVPVATLELSDTPHAFPMERLDRLTWQPWDIDEVGKHTSLDLALCVGERLRPWPSGVTEIQDRLDASVQQLVTLSNR